MKKRWVYRVTDKAVLQNPERRRRRLTAHLIKGIRAAYLDRRSEGTLQCDQRPEPHDRGLPSAPDFAIPNLGL
jgi:hypothetical protein